MPHGQAMIDDATCPPEHFDTRTFQGKNSLISIFTLALLGTAGVATFLAMPIIAAALATHLGLSDRQVGLFSTIQLITLSTGCAVSVILPRRHLRLYGQVALISMMACDAISIGSLGWGLFLLLRGLSGFAGGIAVSRATAALAATRNPERSFGFFLALQTIVAVLCVYLIPSLVAQFGFGSAYALLLLIDLLALAFVSFTITAVPGEIEAVYVGRNDARAWICCLGLLLSILSFFVGIGAVWTFLALLAKRIGLSDAQVSTIITFSKVSAFVASFVPGLLVLRLGRRVAIVGSVSVLVLATQLMDRSTSFSAFLFATGCFSFGWYSLYPFQLAALADADKDGRAILASAALTGIGLGIGPSLATSSSMGIYQTASFAFVFAAALAVTALSFLAKTNSQRPL